MFERQKNSVLKKVIRGKDPIKLFLDSFNHARKNCVRSDPEAMALATSTRPDATPQVRYVLYKGIELGGLIFCSNNQSLKGKTLAKNPKAAVAFYWHEIGMQLRWSGEVKEIPASWSDAYWLQRPWQSRVSSSLSIQSHTLESRLALENDYALAIKNGEKKAPPRPKNWGGFLIIPSSIEFWFAHPYRLHHRIEFSRKSVASKMWKKRELYP